MAVEIVTKYRTTLINFLTYLSAELPAAAGSQQPVSLRKYNTVGLKSTMQFKPFRKERHHIIFYNSLFPEVRFVGFNGQKDLNFVTVFLISLNYNHLFSLMTVLCHIHSAVLAEMRSTNSSWSFTVNG